VPPLPIDDINLPALKPGRDFSESPFPAVELPETVRAVYNRVPYVDVIAGESGRSSIDLQGTNGASVADEIQTLVALKLIYLTNDYTWARTTSAYFAKVNEKRFHRAHDPSKKYADLPAAWNAAEIAAQEAGFGELWERFGERGFHELLAVPAYWRDGERGVEALLWFDAVIREMIASYHWQAKDNEGRDKREVEREEAKDAAMDMINRRAKRGYPGSQKALGALMKAAMLGISKPVDELDIDALEREDEEYHRRRE